jgi:hypothetical protein
MSASSDRSQGGDCYVNMPYPCNTITSTTTLDGIIGIAVRLRSESAPGFNRKRCPQSSESAGKSMRLITVCLRPAPYALISIHRVQADEGPRGMLTLVQQRVAQLLNLARAHARRGS